MKPNEFPPGFPSVILLGSCYDLVSFYLPFPPSFSPQCFSFSDGHDLFFFLNCIFEITAPFFYHKRNVQVISADTKRRPLPGSVPEELRVHWESWIERESDENPVKPVVVCSKKFCGFCLS